MTTHVIAHISMLQLWDWQTWNPRYGEGAVWSKFRVPNNAFSLAIWNNISDDFLVFILSRLENLISKTEWK